MMTQKSNDAYIDQMELLAPAGDLATLKIAIGNGADAVYLGAGNFNARRNAANFTPEELTEAIEYAHQRSVNVYLTLNTLIADDEGDAALELAAAAYTAGIDAIIVQDIGLAAMLHQKLPDLPLHASTQMTISDEAGIRSAAQLGIRRIILPRELSISEITYLTSLARSLGLQTEVFVHGALCVSYSGQCLLSSLIGGRSGNRGECAQPCRLAYQLSNPCQASVMKNGMPFPWLSPKDQALIQYLPELVQAGVSSLKIEGRMRGPAYVGQVVSIYRDALDQPGQPQTTTERKTDRQLLLAFNRGGSFTSRYAGGIRQPNFLAGSYSGSHGLLLGQIIGLEPRFGILKLMLDAAWPVDELPGRGDVLSIRRHNADQEIASAPVGEISQQGRTLAIKGFHPDVLAKFKEGDPVYRMTDRQSERAVQQADRRKTMITFQLSTDPSASQIILSAEIDAGQGVSAGLRAFCKRPAEPVTALAPERIMLQLKKTGTTPFKVSSIQQTGGDICLTIASLNEMRREILDDLAARLVSRRCRDLPPEFNPSWQDGIDAQKRLMQANLPSIINTSAVSAYFYQLPENPKSLACGADYYYVPILSLSSQNAPALRAYLQEQEPDSHLLAWIPPAAAGRMAELLPDLIKSLPEWGFDGCCVGHTGLDYIGCAEHVADSGANIFNQAALLQFIKQGASAICPSLELSSDRLQVLLSLADEMAVPLELPIYGRIRLMISEFCPVGQNLPECRKCHRQPLTPEQPDLSDIFMLKDRKQQSFPLLTHPRVCVSEILSHFIISAPQDVAALLASREKAAHARARLYFLDETPEERKNLSTLARSILVTGESGQRQIAAELLQKAATAVASRSGCSLSFGHYRRGV